MKAAVIVPDWELPPSGGRRGLHLISKTLSANGVDCVTVGRDEGVGDTCVSPADIHPDEDTAIILPEGVSNMNTDYYLEFVEVRKHGPVIQYIQSTGITDPHEEWATHYWGLGPMQREIVREKMGIPEDMPVEELRQPVDGEWWDSGMTYAPGDYYADEIGLPNRIPGSILYHASRNTPTLDQVARKCGDKPVFRVKGATQEELRTLMAIADIFVLASTSEGQSSILNEAMSMEMACVTWPSGSLPDVVTHEETALIVKQNDVVGLSDCVKVLQDDPEYARKLGKDARKWVVEHLSIEGFESRLMELWGQVAS